MAGDFTARVFKLLETELTREEFVALRRLTADCSRNPFVFNRDLNEFVTDDDWGLEFDEGVFDEVADLVARCCDALNRHGSGDKEDLEEEHYADPAKTGHYSVAFSLRSSEYAKVFAEALHRNGYQYTVRKVTEGQLIEVGFSARSDYENYRERDNIRLLLEVAERKADGKNFLGGKVT